MADCRKISSQETYAFRQAVLWPDRPLSHVMIDGDDEALHIGMFDKDQMVGVGSFFIDLPKARLRKLAIAPSHQRRGLGSDLIMQAIQMLKHDGVILLWCDARQNALGFYEALGFELKGDIFFKSGLPYVVAQLPLLDGYEEPAQPRQRGKIK